MVIYPAGERSRKVSREPLRSVVMEAQRICEGPYITPRVGISSTSDSSIST